MYLEYSVLVQQMSNLFTEPCVVVPVVPSSRRATPCIPFPLNTPSPTQVHRSSQRRVGIGREVLVHQHLDRGRKLRDDPVRELKANEGERRRADREEGRRTARRDANSKDLQPPTISHGLV